MSYNTGISDHLFLEGLINVWKQRDYDLYFYFNEIFDRALAALKSSIETSTIQITANGEPIYKGMFIPVGFSAENVALISVLFGPLHLTVAFSETTKAFHRKHFHIVEEKIRQYCPSTTIDKIPSITSDDQLHMEKRILEWAQKMKANYGFSEDQLVIDLTGGTKPMSIGAQNAARSLDISAFYLSVDYDIDTQEPIPGTESLLEMVRRQSQTDENSVFVIMPFSKEFDSVYMGIRDSANKAQLRCSRMDEEIFSGGIMDKVRENIAKAGIIIADLSEHNPNVYYELGLAHGWGKMVIMITQDIGNVPFDLKHLRMVMYDRGSIDGLREKLGEELAGLKTA